MNDQSFNSTRILNKGKYNKFENKLGLNRVNSTLLFQNNLNKRKFPNGF